MTRSQPLFSYSWIVQAKCHRCGTVHERTIARRWDVYTASHVEVLLPVVDGDAEHMNLEGGDPKRPLCPSCAAAARQREAEALREAARKELVERRQRLEVERDELKAQLAAEEADLERRKKLVEEELASEVEGGGDDD